MKHQGKFFPYAHFKDDARNGNLPAYTFIEPTYDDDGQGNFANSQHPDFPIDRGEGLISDIYNALTKSLGWTSTLFLILYDEHGGTFDHVVPPTVTRLPSSAGAPDVPVSPNPPFDFIRLGVRVPAVFVSPCIPPNTVLNHCDYEHSSVVATVRKLFCRGTAPLTWREAQANMFDNVLTLTGTQIRTDVVPLPPPVVSTGVPIQAASAEERGPTDLSMLMALAVEHSMTASGIPTSGPAATQTTAAQVSAYLQDAQRRIVASGGQQ